jgi:hypothetical protein
MPSDPTRDPHVNTLGELRVIGARGVVRGDVVTTVGLLRTRLAEPSTLSSLAGEVHLSLSACPLVRRNGRGVNRCTRP